MNTAIAITLIICATILFFYFFYVITGLLKSSKTFQDQENERKARVQKILNEFSKWIDECNKEAEEDAKNSEILNTGAEKLNKNSENQNSNSRNIREEMITEENNSPVVESKVAKKTTKPKVVAKNKVAKKTTKPRVVLESKVVEQTTKPRNYVSSEGKNCVRCGRYFIPKSNRQKFCTTDSVCKPLTKEEQNELDRILNSVNKNRNTPVHIN